MLDRFFEVLLLRFLLLELLLEYLLLLLQQINACIVIDKGFQLLLIGALISSDIHIGSSKINQIYGCLWCSLVLI